MLAQLWNGGYVLDWSGLILEFAGAALAAFAILPANSTRPDADANTVRATNAYLILQSRQLRLGLIILAFGVLLQCAGTLQAAVPFFAK